MPYLEKVRSSATRSLLVVFGFFTFQITSHGDRSCAQFRLKLPLGRVAVQSYASIVNQGITGLGG